MCVLTVCQEGQVIGVHGEHEEAADRLDELAALHPLEVGGDLGRGGGVGGGAAGGGGVVELALGGFEFRVQLGVD